MKNNINNNANKFPRKSFIHINRVYLSQYLTFCSFKHKVNRETVSKFIKVFERKFEITNIFKYYNTFDRICKVLFSKQEIGILKTNCINIQDIDNLDQVEVEKFETKAEDLVSQIDPVLDYYKRKKRILKCFLQSNM